MKRRVVISFLIILAALGLVAGTARFVFASRPDDASTADTTESQRVYSVELAEASPGNVRSVIHLNGDVVPITNVEAYPDTAGEVQQLFVRLGDRVRRGQVIANVDPSRPGALFEASPVSSPISGTVTAVYVDRGDTVGTSSPIVAIGELDALEVVVDIPERFVSTVRTGMTAEIELSAFAGTTFAVTANEISPVLDATTRSKEVRFALDPEATGAEAGMFAEVTIVTEERIGVVVVPVESIVTRAGSDYVFTTSNRDSAELRAVEVGLIHDQMAEVRSGLQPGEAVVVRGQSVIEDGSSIRVLNQGALATGGDS